MAPRARILDPKTGYGDTDTESDGDDETPKKPRQNLRKRLSEVHNDHSFSSDSGRIPLKPVNMNDDAAEKRRRRKSTKLAILDSAQGGPSMEGYVAEQDQPETSRMAKQKQQLTSVAQTPVINVPLDVMSSNFEEWMKMATDNKINAANSWNFALIDYFHDMSLLRNNTDNSINFQRASCTLDGCVKIWTSRVDSVGTETGKLLSNLASDGRANDEDEPTSDNPDAQQQKKKKGHRSEATLAKNPLQLRSKKLDLEFSVDPLFKKTCADFDEGGAQGLLMNHLSLGVGTEGGMRVVFDASDSMGKATEEEETREPEETVDLSFLRKEFFPDLTVLDAKAISHSLANFSFSKDAITLDSFDDTAYQDDTPQYDDDDNEEHVPFTVDNEMNVDEAGPPVEDFFQGEQAVGDDFANGPDDYGGDFAANGPMGAEADQEQNGGHPGPLLPFDPRKVPNERDLVLAMTDAEGDGGMMDYFDQNFLKNWAGPEHWKLRKVVRKPEAAETKTAKAPKEKKEAFKIDFLSPIEKDIKEIAKELFVPVTKGPGINLPGTGPAAKTRKGKKARDKEKKDDHRLPDDMHFSSRQLVTLFLKPKFSLKMRGQRVRFNERDGEVDVNFWAQAADQAAGRTGDDDDGDETANDNAIPFNTQFFHDDYDDGPGFDDAFEADGEGAMGTADADEGEQDLLASTQGQRRRVRPEFVNYAKRAKRVDVRKLKENIWRGLDIVIPRPEEDMELDEPPAATDPSEARVFSSVISGLQKTYPQEKMEEISTSFCFICLLHLANEQGLRLQSTKEVPDDDSADDEGIDKKIGNIWELQVYRDPNASSTPQA